jgi:NADPH:quinone reductase-like Zn-dependent oxidoreductase
MKAFVIDRFGGPLHAAEMPRPSVGDRDVLVQVHAASLNPVDYKIRDGKLKAVIPYRLPLILGNDLSGIVVEVGAGVRQFKVGDAVYARADKGRIGSLAEFIAVNEDSVAPMPASLGMEEAAAVPLVALTALQAFDRAGLKSGQKVLIHAGSGGVGTVAIQLAKHRGAFVATTTSTAHVEWVKALGADLVIDYKTQDFATQLRDYDLVFDTLGGTTTGDSLPVLKPGGWLVSVSGPPDPAFAREWQLGWLKEQAMRLLSHRIRKLARQRGVTYSFLFMHPSGAQLRELGALIDAGALRPVIDRVFAFEESAEALAYLETGRAKGKVVVKVC